MNLSVVITALSTMSEQLSHNIKARALTPLNASHWCSNSALVR